MESWTQRYSVLSTGHLNLLRANLKRLSEPKSFETASSQSKQIAHALHHASGCMDRCL